MLSPRALVRDHFFPAFRGYKALGRLYLQPDLRSTCTRVRPFSATHCQMHGYEHTKVHGEGLLNDPHYNKGTSFSSLERKKLGINGRLPSNVQSLDQQVTRAYQQYSALENDLQKNTFLTSLAEQNVVLYYRLLQSNLKEMFSIVYTPTEGSAIENYSRVFRKPQGCFLDITKPEEIEERLSQFAVEGEDYGGIDYIVVSDGEQILGIGDQGTGGILISVAKLVLSTVCAGVHPKRTLGVVLDVGTNNQKLLDDDMYLGLKQKRADGEQYDQFVDGFMKSVKKVFPAAYIHFEDFGVNNARRLLNRYKTGHGPVFNDDIQGTGCVTTASVIAAAKLADVKMRDLRVVCFGAGSAGIGISEQIAAAIAADANGSQDDARKQIYCFDKSGLLLDDNENLSEAQKPFAKGRSDCQKFDTESLQSIIDHVKPHVLLGVSTAAGAFTQNVVETMSNHVEKPIIFPLSNPTQLAEAKPEDILTWTKGKALVATGSPFPPVTYDGESYCIGECNNSVCFPGLGLACILGRTKSLSDGMLVAAVNALAEQAPAVKKQDLTLSLCPDIEEARDISAKIAVAVLKQADKEDLLGVDKRDLPLSDDKALESWILERMWDPIYEDQGI